MIIFAQGPNHGLYRVPAGGGSSVRITEFDASRNEIGHAWPFFLPDGRHFLYLARSTQPENSAIYVGSLDSKETKRLLQVHSSIAFAPPQYLLFVREDTLTAQAFDAERLELTGEQFPVVEQITRNPINGRAFFSVSENGVLVVRTGDLALNQLTWFDRTGKQLGVITSSGNYSAPSLSPDEKRVAVSRLDFQTTTAADIWVIDLERGGEIAFHLRSGQRQNSGLVARRGPYRLCLDARRADEALSKALDLAGGEDALLSSYETKSSPDWSPDARFILYAQLNAATSWDLFVLPLSGERKPEPFLQTNFVEIHGRFSPDGRWVAYVSNETGQFQVYVQSFPPSGGKWPVSIDGGSQPRWRDDGRELYYFTPERKLMAVEVNGQAAKFEVGVPRPLFEFRVGGAGIDLVFPGSGYYTAARDGKRFLVAASSEVPERQQINVILNWSANLNR